MITRSGKEAHFLIYPKPDRFGCVSEFEGWIRIWTSNRGSPVYHSVKNVQNVLPRFPSWLNPNPRDPNSPM